jgi:hypothetical protein
MDLYTKHAKLLGSYEAMLLFAIDALKGKTSLSGNELAEYLEKRIKEINEEINTQ